MDVETATRTIASYVVGRRIDAATLEEACRVVRQDPETVARLRAELGVGERPGIGCSTFGSRLAEFAGLTPMRQLSEMPLFLAHVDQCAACRDLLEEEILPLWAAGEVVTEKRGGTSMVYRLLEPLRVILRDLGDLAAGGSSRLSPAAAPGGAVMGPEERIPDWRFPLMEGAVTARVVAQRTKEDQVELRVNLASEEGPPPPARLEVLEADTGERVHIGDTASARRAPPVLRPGSYRLRIQPSEGVWYEVEVGLFREGEDRD